MELAPPQLAPFQEGGASASADADVSIDADPVVDESLGEAAPVIARRQPVRPTPEEVRLHEACHYPYRHVLVLG